jgi:heme-degrading monooxygenase HmoA
MSVILINPFEVPTGQEEACLRLWERTRDYMARQPGYRGTPLHRALSPDARFTFMNVAEWDSAEQFYAAVQREEFTQLTAGSQAQFPHDPGVYEVIRT